MLTALRELMSFAVQKNALANNYTLLGHRQTRITECPGDRLYQEISRWTHFGSNYSVVKS